MANLKDQISALRSVDALVVLGGEQTDRSRTNHALCLYSVSARQNGLPLVLSGCGSGVRPNSPMTSEAEEMKGYLRAGGVPEQHLFIEPKGRDTLANIVLSAPLLGQLEARRVGLITDAYHIRRGMWTAQRVWGSRFEISPLPTSRRTTFFGRVVECAVLNAQRYDLWWAGLEPGDQEGFERYLREAHPFHAPLEGNKPSFGAYRLGIYALNLLR